MRFSVLASGSKANCTFVEAAGTRLLIDCGLSARETNRRLMSLGIDPHTVCGILITHEHSDHIRGVPTLSRSLNIPVFITEATADALGWQERVEHFRPGSRFSVGKLEIDPFNVVHDAVDPVGFVVRGEGLKFAQATDLGRTTPVVQQALQGAHAVVLESNHDQDLLRSCGYPWVLKQRIRSSHGHLSNDSCATFLNQIFHSELLHVVLAHLSENSNTPELALASVSRYLPAERRSAGQLRTLLCGSVQAATPLLMIDEKLSVADNARARTALA